MKHFRGLGGHEIRGILAEHMASVTFAVPARNAGRTILRCLGQIRAGSVRAQRVLVLDDRSEDDTARIASTMGAEVLAVEGLNGIAAARNAALANCDTPFLAFINADCYVEKAWLEILLGELVAHDAAIVGGRQLELRHDSLAERWKAIHLRQDWGIVALVDPDFLSGGNLLIDCRRTAMLRFDDRYAKAYEDVDFCRRARAAGLRLLYEPTAIVHHDHRETLRTLPGKVWSYGASSSTLGIEKRTDVVRAFVRMHLRPRDHVRTALRSDWHHARLTFLLIDFYLLFASLSLFVLSGIAPSRLDGSPAALRR